MATEDLIWEFDILTTADIISLSDISDTLLNRAAAEVSPRDAQFSSHGLLPLAKALQ